MTDHMKLTDILMDELPEEHPWKGNIKGLVERLIANGVTLANQVASSSKQVASSEWISVENRLPDTAERVLVCKTWLGMVYKPVYGYYQDFPNRKGCWYVLTEEGYYPQREVTHWMPLPQPPKGE